MPSEATVKIALFMSSPRVWQEFSISFFPHNNYDAANQAASKETSV
jgi:hypothetical protein